MNNEDLFLDRNDEEPVVVPFLGGTVVLTSRRHPVREGPNQDGAAIAVLTADRGLLAVADGMGGLPRGDRAAATALGRIAASARGAAAAGSSVFEALLEGCDRANEDVAELGGGAGTTLALVDVRASGEVRSLHVGDTAVLIVGQRGKIKHLTVSHSPVGYGVEAGLIDEEDALDHEDRHLISNMIGSPAMKIEFGPALALAPRDTVLVASDGLLDNLRVQEIVETVRKGSVVAAARALVVKAAARMQGADPGPSKPDDLTFLLYRRS